MGADALGERIVAVLEAEGGSCAGPGSDLVPIEAFVAPVRAEVEALLRSARGQ